MKLKPLFDRVVVEPENEDKSKGGIFLGSQNADGVKIGRVLFIGEGNEKQDGQLSKMVVNIGDRVVFNKYSAIDANIDGKTLLVLRQTDILAIIE